MRTKAFLALVLLTGGACADDDYLNDYGTPYGSGYIYERQQAEEQPRSYILKGPILMPNYGGPAISSGTGSGQDFVGSTHTLRGSCFSAYGFTSCY